MFQTEDAWFIGWGEVAAVKGPPPTHIQFGNIVHLEIFEVFSPKRLSSLVGNIEERR